MHRCARPIYDATAIAVHAYELGTYLGIYSYYATLVIAGADVPGLQCKPLAVLEVCIGGLAHPHGATGKEQR